MRVLQEALDDALRKVPEQVLREMLATKLKAEGTGLSASRLSRLLRRLLKDETDTITVRRWQWWNDRDISIEWTERDDDEIECRVVAATDQVLGKLGDLSNELSEEILESLKRGWRREKGRQQRQRAGFERRLNQRWGQGLDRLAMLLIVCREFGDDVNEDLRRPSSPSPSKVDVLTRLHARACQVVQEIGVLLRAGLADGAMARWRTLHEIAVIAMFVCKHGDDLSERYVLHQRIESRRAGRDYVNCQDRLGYEPMESSEIAELDQLRNDLIDRFGKTYDTPYGWAADQLGVGRPTFSDIERAAGIDHFRAHYRMASHNVHANPKGIFFKLGLLDEVDLLLTGSSDAGLASPGHSAAISLAQVSTPLVLLHPTLDNLVIAKVMLRLVDEIGQAFGDAHEELVSHSAKVDSGDLQRP